jgi:hypothetical protein
MEIIPQKFIVKYGAMFETLNGTNSCIKQSRPNAFLDDTTNLTHFKKFLQ